MARKTVEEKQAELKAISLNIQKKVNEFIDSPELIVEFIRFSDQFHQYSLRNRMLIQSQNRVASFVAGYNEWKNKGYQVNKGEKGIKIMRPTLVYEFQNRKGEWIEQKFATLEEKEQIKQQQLQSRQRFTGVTLSHVFDISQTNVPLEDYPHYLRRHFVSDSKRDAKDYIEGCRAFSKENNLQIETQHLGATVGGYYQPDKHRIVLNSQLENEKAFGTFVHEIAHSQLHRENEGLSKEAEEIQAQTVSAVVLQYYGFEPYEYSLNYLKEYGKQLKDEERIQLIESTLETSTKLVQSIDRYIEQREQFKTVQNEHDLSKQAHKSTFQSQRPRPFERSL